MHTLNEEIKIKKSREKIFFSISLFSWKKEFFLRNFSFRMWEEKRFFWIFLFTSKKNQKKNEFLSTKMSKISDFLWKEKRFFFHFSLRKKKFQFFFSYEKKEFFWEISLFAYEKKRDCLFIFLFNDHSAEIKWNFFYSLS